MRHPSEGVLRRLLDEPAGVAEPDRRHVADCDACLQEVADMRADAALVGAAMAPRVADGTDRDTDVAAAWQRLQAAAHRTPDGVTDAVAGAPAGTSRRAGRSAAASLPTRARGVLRRPAVAALAVGVALAGAGTAAATDWLQVFRTERVAPVTFSTADLVAVPDLDAYGDVQFVRQPELREVADASEAAALSGLDVPDVADLPDGVVGDPTYQVGDEVSATFTFSVDSARRAADAVGEPLPAPPPGLDGTAIRIDAGPGVAAVWTSSAGVPSLAVARAVAPTAFSASGLPFEQVRDYLLAMPGVPDDVEAQLRSFAADGSTLPLPAPSDYVETSQAEVDGVSATVLEARDRSVAAVLWVEDGVVHAVAGSLGADEVLEVARSLE